ncbi:DNA-binding XRE family transcriptional regulator [Hydrogenispora ethanolica]|uniref:DNA-binding XRE family transcriptional regulator n=1 Tax=Hydrogenispora ethanolica TaxID=1082276 RepID=A0A4R1R2V3_HYDET|nr:helix-turn-helix transcriptional regulator [Hydrogenispora ethanolica]TCL59709.1 DNA-binding XRE family transcriptional regulator [Hydrogenispora ethanolica]
MPQNVLGAKLKKLRKEQNLTQSELSRLLGLSENYIAKVESGVRPSMETFRKLADFFQVPIEYLVSEREEQTAALPVRNPEVFEAMVEVDRMESEDQRLVLDVVKVILQKNRCQVALEKKGRK